MADWTVKDYILAGVVLSAIIGISYLMVGSMATEYNTPGIVDEGFSTKYDRFTNQTSDITKMWNATAVESDRFSLLGAGVEIFKAGIAVVNLIFGGFVNIKEQVQNTAGDFGVPSPIFNIISILFIVTLTVLIIWGVINFLNKTGPI